MSGPAQPRDFLLYIYVYIRIYRYLLHDSKTTRKSTRRALYGYFIPHHRKKKKKNGGKRSPRTPRPFFSASQQYLRESNIRQHVYSCSLSLRSSVSYNVADKIFCVHLPLIFLSFPAAHNGENWCARAVRLIYSFALQRSRVLDRKNTPTTNRAMEKTALAGQDLPAMRNHWTVTSRKILDTRTGTLGRARARQKKKKSLLVGGWDHPINPNPIVFIYRGPLLVLIYFRARPTSLGGAYLYNCNNAVHRNANIILWRPKAPPHRIIVTILRQPALKYVRQYLYYVPNVT